MALDLTDQIARAQAAQRAWAVLPHGGRDAVELRVTCARSHHVATVYGTDIGWVYAAPVRSHSHGDRDLPDVPRGEQHPHEWFDVLVDDGSPDDVLPAWCDCGHRALSRAAVLDWLRAKERHVVID